MNISKLIILFALITYCYQSSSSLPEGFNPDAVRITDISTSPTIRNYSREGSIIGGTHLYIRGKGYTIYNPKLFQITVGSYPCNIVEFLSTSDLLVCETTPATEPGQFPVIVRVNENVNADCLTDCRFTYSLSQTSVLERIIPQTTTQNEVIQIRGLWNTDSSENVEIRIGKYICGKIENNTIALEKKQSSSIYCRVGKIPTGVYNLSVSVSGSPGLTQNSYSSYYKSYAFTQVYQFEVVPKITSVNANTGSVEGQILTIHGQGFSDKAVDINVKVGDLNCTVVNTKYDKITCIIQKGQPTKSNRGYEGGAFERKNINGLYNWIAEESKEDITNPNKKQQKQKELDYDNLDYQSLYSDYFKAPLTGLYRFYLNAQAYTELHFETKPGQTEKICQIEDDKDFSQFPEGKTQISKFISLKVGQLYLMEIKQISGQKNNVSVGVEIPSDQVEQYATLPEIQKISWKSKPKREVLSFKIWGAKGGQFSLQLKQNTEKGEKSIDKKSLDIPFNASIQQFKQQIQNLVQASVEVIRKPLNQNGKTQNSEIGSVGYEWQVTFNKFRSSKDLPILDISKLEGNVKQIVTQIEQGSQPISGTFSIINDNQISRELNYNIGDYELKQALIEIGFDKNIHVIGYGDPQESKTFEIYFPGSTKIQTFKIDQTNFYSDPSQSKVQIQVEVTRKGKNRANYFNVIPNELLVTKHNTPQITLHVKGIRAICSNKASCNYTIINDTLPIITQFKFDLDAGRLNVSISNATACKNQTKLSLYLGQSQCLIDSIESYIDILKTQACLIKCHFKNNSMNFPQVVAGRYFPQVNYEGIGFTKIHYGLTLPIEIKPFIQFISPSRASIEAGVLITIRGKYFGTKNKDKIEVKIGQSKCDIKYYNNSEIQCFLLKKFNNIPVDVSVNDIRLSEYGKFAFDTSLAPIIHTVSHLSASPVSKQRFYIRGRNFGRNLENIKVNFDTDSQYGAFQCIPYYVNWDEIQCMIVGGKISEKPYYVRVEVIGQGSSKSNNILHFEIKVISVEPNSGSVGGGTIIGIHGTNFSPIKNDNTVLVGGQTCHVLQSQSNYINCKIQETDTNIVGKQEVRVYGKLTELAKCTGLCVFEFKKNLTPELISVSKNTVLVDEEITLTVDNLQNEKVNVTIGDKQCNITQITQSSVKIKIPLLEGGQIYELKIQNKFGYAISKIPIKIEVVLRITSVTPKIISKQGGLIVINGNGFTNQTKVQPVLQYNDKIKFNCDIRSLKENQIICSLESLQAFHQAIVFKVKQRKHLITCDSCVVPVTNATIGKIKSFGENSFTYTNNLHIVLQNSGEIEFSEAPQTLVATYELRDLTSLKISYDAFNIKFDQGKFEVKPQYIPAGSYTLRIGDHERGYFIDDQSILNVNVSWFIKETHIEVSLLGGHKITLEGNGFNLINDFNDIRICGESCDVLEANQTQIKCQIPQLRTSKTVREFDLATESILDNLYWTTNQQNNIQSDVIRQYETNQGSCWIKADAGFQRVADITSIKYNPEANKILSDYQGITVEGSHDNEEWTLLFNLSDVNYGSKTWRPQGLTRYRYIRLNNQSNTDQNQCALKKFEISGYLVWERNPESLGQVKCPIALKSGIMEFITSSTVTYKEDLTPVVTSVSPKYGSVAGNTMVTIKGNGFSKVSWENIVIIDGAYCQIWGATENQIYCKTEPKPYKIERCFEVLVSKKGSAISRNHKFIYADKWSSPVTWKGELPPFVGDSVHIPKEQAIVVDISVPHLKNVTVEGELIFEDQGEKTFDADFIFVKNGKIEIGTEEEPYKSKLTITLHGKPQKEKLPQYGNKCIALRNGILDIHGPKRNPTWTQLKETANVGTNQITVLGKVDWRVGEEIVIASTSFNNREAEVRKILLVKIEEDYSIIQLNKSLEFKHYAGIQTFGKDTLEMRAEVGLLSRNIIIQGDSNSQELEYGVHIMAIGDYSDQSVVRIEYAEVRQAGQAFNQGRYPINLHLIGEVHQSYIRGNSIHHTYNRAVGAHGVHFLRIIDNVAYHVKGHTYFIEDGIETQNVLEGNLGIQTMVSWILEETDQTPATFYITNPYNYFRNNQAAGGDGYGFWFNLKQFPTGSSATNRVCPRGMPLGEFKNNTAHSYGRHGIRISNNWIPRENPCKPAYDLSQKNPFEVNKPIPATLKENTAWKCKLNGILGELLGDVRFIKSKVADNKVAGIQISQTDKSPAWKSTRIQDALIARVTENSDPQEMEGKSTRGIITPKGDGLIVDNIRFYNFNESKTSAIGSRYLQEASTDSGARTTRFSRLSFNNVKQKIIYSAPFRDIFQDMDGSLTEQPNGGWAVYDWPHLNASQCKLNKEVYDGLVCDDQIQIRRILFYKPQFTYQMKGLDLRVLRLQKDGETSQPINQGLSLIPFRHKGLPKNTWALPFITGYTYNLQFSEAGIDINKLQIRPSKVWEANDQPIDIAFNYTGRRDKYNSSLTIYEGNQNQVFESTDSIPSNPTLGTVTNLLSSKQAILRIDGSQRGEILLEAIRCWPDCNKKTDEVVVESNYRKWSDIKNWPNNKLPGVNDNVVIPSTWKMILDIDTPILDKLEINGELKFDENISGDKLTLNAKKIWVKNGKLLIGTPEKPYTKKAQIILHGLIEDDTLAIDSSIEGANKILAITGEAHLYGKTTDNIWTYLSEVANPQSTEIKVINAIGFEVADDILITTSSFKPNDTEVRRISKVQGNTITLDKPLQFVHYGAQNSIDTSSGKLEIRAEVAKLNRNIVIKSEQSNQQHGCTILVSDLQESNSRVLIKFDGVEIQNCGQFKSSKPAIKFEQISQGGQTSSLTRSVIRDSLFNGMSLISSRNIEIINNVIYNTVQHGVSVHNSNDYNFSNNLIALIHNRKFNTKQAAPIVDMTTGFILYNQPERKFSNNVTIKNNVVSGSHQFGWIIPGNECQQDESFELNSAHSSEYGFWLLENMSQCISITKLTAYKCEHGILTYSNRVKDIQATQLLVTDNKAGITLNIGREGKDLKILLQKSYIAGQSFKNCQKCYGSSYDCSELTGIRAPVITTSGKDFPIKSQSQLPLHTVGSDSSFYAQVDINNNTIVDFQNTDKQCKDNYFIKTNPSASDYTPPVRMTQNKIINVGNDNKYFIDSPKTTWINKNDCGDWQCTGFDNILFKDLDGSIMGTPSSILGHNQGIAKKGQCQFRKYSSNYVCDTTRYGTLMFQSNDPNQKSRIISPVYVTGANDFNTKLNSFMDHMWHGFFTGNKRQSRFPVVIPLDSKYDIKLTGSNPKNMLFQLQGADSHDYAIIRVHYNKGEAVNVYAQGIIQQSYKVDSSQPTSNDQLDLNQHKSLCGKNKYYFRESIIEFVITGQSWCQVELKQVISMTATLEFNITNQEFLKATNQTLLINRLSGLLQISTNNIKIDNNNTKSNSIDVIVQSNELTGDESTNKLNSINSELKKQIDIIARLASTGQIGGTEYIKKIQTQASGIYGPLTHHIHQGTFQMYEPNLRLSPQHSNNQTNSSNLNSLIIGCAVILLIGVIGVTTLILKKKINKNNMIIFNQEIEFESKP